MTVRTARLKRDVIIKTHRIIARGLVEETGDTGKPFREGMEVKLCLDRAKLLTEGYMNNEHEPLVIKRAKALSHVLENMKIFILPNELLVGNFASTPNGVCHYPELQWRWLEKTICTPEGPYKELLTEEEKKDMLAMHKYWKTRAIHGMERQQLPEEAKKFFYYKGVSFWNYFWEMSTPNYEKVFAMGFAGIIKEIDERLKNLDNDYSEIKINAKDYLDQKRDLEAMKIALAGAIKWAKRYSALALEMAAQESDEQRKKELERLADICNWVPENPARTFYDAMQCFWLIHLIVNYLDEPQVGCGARFDKMLYPYYKKDLEEGRITREEAQELLECMWLKFLETGFLHPPIWSGSGGGGLGWQTVTVGGIDEKGEDITNDVTYLVLESIKALHTLQPPLALRVHGKTPRELLVKTTEVLNTGVAQPALFNDDVNMERLVSLGVPREDAYDYGISNCMWPVVPGKNIVHRCSNAGSIFIPKCLELALNQGRDMKSGEQLGPVTKDPLQFTSIDEVIDASVEQFMYAAKGLFRIASLANKLYEDFLPRPFVSALIDGCIEKGQELRKWTYMPYNDTWGPMGLTTFCDAVAATKKVVFDDKKATMAELLEALKKNWEGYEELRTECLNAPKFGNDDDYVDFITRDIHYRLTKEITAIKAYANGVEAPALLDGSAASSGYSYAIDTWATPDGRMAGTAFNDGTISPVMGRDTKGPTASLLSASKIDPLKSFNHLFNQTFVPQYLQGEYVERFADYLKTWQQMGIHHIQFSVVDEEVLKDAQVRPAEYPELIVRVCGYAAYFIDLSRGLQDSIIGRTAQQL